MALLGLYGLGVAAVGLVELLRVDAAARAIHFFHEGRLAEPAGYSNANTALWSTALWPCLLLGVRRELPALLRGLFMGSAGLLGSLAVLGQSRGWLITLPLMAVVAVAVVPGRGRTILGMLAVAVGVGAIAGTLLDVYDNFDPQGPPGAAFSEAMNATLLVSAALAVVGTLAAFADRAVELREQTARRLSGLTVGAFVAAGLIAGVVALAAVSDPLGELEERWDEFKAGGSEPTLTGNRFSAANFSSYRSDAWTVAWENFERRPITGVGADNFLRDYMLRGGSDQTPLYPHSLFFRTISQTGLVGLLLLGAAFVAALLAALPALRRGRGLAGAAAGAAIVTFAYWVLHGQLDWFWEFAGLGGPAIAMLGMAAALGWSEAARRSERPVLAADGESVNRPLALAAAGAALLLALAVAAPWLAERDLRGAGAMAAESPDAAVERLDRAAALNPLAPAPEKAAGVIEARRGRLSAARAHFLEVLERDEGDSYAWMQLAAIASASGEPAVAERYIAWAREWAPRDQVVRTVQRRLERGRTVTPTDVEAIVARDVELRIGRG